jgi:hypothetical protein
VYSGSDRGIGEDVANLLRLSIPIAGVILYNTQSINPQVANAKLKREERRVAEIS